MLLPVTYAHSLCHLSLAYLRPGVIYLGLFRLICYPIVQEQTFILELPHFPLAK